MSWNKLEWTRRKLGRSSRTLILVGRVPGISRRKFLTSFAVYMTTMDIQATVLESWNPSKEEAGGVVDLVQEYDLLVLMGVGWWGKLLETGSVRDWTDGLVDFSATVGKRRLRVLNFKTMEAHPIEGMRMHLNWVSLEAG